MNELGKTAEKLPLSLPPRLKDADSAETYDTEFNTLYIEITEFDWWAIPIMTPACTAEANATTRNTIP